MLAFPRLLIATTLVVMSHWLSIPLYALTLEARGETGLFIGCFVAMPSAMLLLGMGFLPKLTSHLGVGRAFRVGVAINLLMTALLYVSDNVWLWLAAASMIGLGNGFFWVASESWLAQIVKDDQRGRTIGLVETFVGLAMAAAALLVALINARFQFGVLIMMGCNLCALLLMTGLSDPASEAHDSNETSLSYLHILRLCPLLFSASLLGGFSEGLAAPMFPLLGVAKGLTAQQATLLMSLIGVVNIASQYPIGYCCDRWHESRVFHLCIMLAIAGALSMALLPVLYLAVGVTIWALGVGSGYTLAIIVAGRYFSGGTRVAAMALTLIGYNLGTILGPIVGGAALDYFGASGISIVLILACVLAWPFIRAPQARLA
jgi:MFS family permease